jgi:hypothetical protein
VSAARLANLSPVTRELATRPGALIILHALHGTPAHLRRLAARYRQTAGELPEDDNLGLITVLRAYASKAERRAREIEQRRVRSAIPPFLRLVGADAD